MVGLCGHWAGRETSRIGIGTLVTPVTFRYPGVLAVQVAQVDQMSGGRVELGLGAGWYEAEHTAYGILFPGNRFDLLEEQLTLISGLWGHPVGMPCSFGGPHYQLTESPALPKPVQREIPIIIGGQGPKRTPALTAMYASEFNSFLISPSELGDRYARVRQACEAINRDPDETLRKISRT